MAGVYISYPFCAQKCTYCNFASGVFPHELESRYLEALRSDIRAVQWPSAAGLGKMVAQASACESCSYVSGICWIPETVYLGGGTPSRMAPAALADLLNMIPGKPWMEATIEAAPGGITFDLARAWREAGINRVSLGVQSFDPRELARTGRRHMAETVAAEVGALRAAGLSNFNIDLIAGLPGQTQPSWIGSLDWIERLNPPHVSIYMLEVDEDSRLGAEVLAFGKRYGARDLPSEDAIADFYEVAVERLAGMGIRRYEISNFARPGFESRHNLKYWRLEPYIGFGADAHSFDGSLRWENAETPAEYVDRIARGLSPEVARSAAGSGEAFFLGLRMEEGVDADWSRYREAVERCMDAGLLEAEGRRLRLTPRGVLLSNEVFAEFV